MRDQTARAYHTHVGNEHRNELITFTNAFHGRTMATISASSQGEDFQGSCRCCRASVMYLDDLCRGAGCIGPNTAGFLVEPVQGEGDPPGIGGIHAGEAAGAGRRT